MKRIYKQASSSRIRILLWLCYAVGVLLLIRVFGLQVVRGRDDGMLQNQGNNQIRGELFAVDGPEERERSPIAVNEPLWLLYAEPNKVTDVVRIVKELGSATGIPEEELLGKLQDSRDVYVPLKHFVTDEVRNKVELLDLQGVGFSSELRRSYPMKSVFAHLTGFVGFSNEQRIGQYGLEGWYQDELGSRVDMKGEEHVRSLIISVNKTVQDRACAYLREGVSSYAATSGSVIVMDPFTGYVKVLCAEPGFDPNEYGKTDPSLFIDPVLSGAYEPGSVYKPITIASALDAGTITPSTKFVDSGSVQFGKFTIRNAEDKTYGEVTMTEVLEESINTGVIFAQQSLGNETFLRYTKQFGFGSKTGIDLAVEVAGNISALETKKDIYAATASFGQGITATPIQLARSYAALANGGTLVTPRIGFAFTDGTSETLISSDEIPKQIISPHTSSVISAMLASVVVDGHSKGSSIPGYFIAGKTGTAQVVDSGTGVYGRDTIHTFAGFFPLNKPRFVVVVRIDRPQKGKYAESTAVPVFKNIAQFLIQYYKIPPER